MKSIWLPANKEFDSDGILKKAPQIVARNEPKIINPKRLTKIIDELKDYRNFILTYGNRKDIDKFLSMNEVELKKNNYYLEQQLNKVIFWEERTTYHGREDDELLILENPYPNILDFIIGDAKESFDMKKLLGSCSNMNIEYFLEVLEGAKKSNVDIHPILMATIPEIGKFSSEILNCIELVEVEEKNIIELNYELDELEKKCEKCKKSSTREVLINQYRKMHDEISSMHKAQENHRVLSLARRIAKII